jgi:hypothetical protein
MNMPIPAVIGIVSFVLAMKRYTLYYQTPMGIIGKVYANSMLVLINTRMVLGSEETPSMIIESALELTTIPANNEDSAIEVHNGDVALDID